MTTNNRKPIKKVDRGNTSLEYWEQVLESHGLAEKDLGVSRCLECGFKFDDGFSGLTCPKCYKTLPVADTLGSIDEES